ncbi:TIGR01777 family oxidoreductase [Fodinicola acaciae]|uniref:TIGR01777 family oxidoreductase n=1 Tax=Fodinicola acaciae TaxID=2681555 RepID=UPI0013D2D54F|nr:TIGR01777 family oxidoreductase [Fodinicola acaciae]
MRVVIAGSSGLIGTALRHAYERDGDTVTRLVRRPPAGPGELRWDPATPDPALVAGADVVINLAGAGIGDHRWTRDYREKLRSSRLVAARTIAASAAAADPPPGVLLSMSGIRFYGIDRGDEPLTEDSTPGDVGLLTTIAREWEVVGEAAGVRTCFLRTGLVMSRHGGLLPPLLRLNRLGVSPCFWSGNERWSCLSLTDAIRAIRFLATNADASGPYNISAPEPPPNRELMRVLAAATGARVRVRLPAPVLRVMLGKMADEVFGSLRVMPRRLHQAGFDFRHPDAKAIVRAALE